MKSAILILFCSTLATAQSKPPVIIHGALGQAVTQAVPETAGATSCVVREFSKPFNPVVAPSTPTPAPSPLSKAVGRRPVRPNPPIHPTPIAKPVTNTTWKIANGELTGMPDVSGLSSLFIGCKMPKGNLHERLYVWVKPVKK